MNVVRWMLPNNFDDWDEAGSRRELVRGRPLLLPAIFVRAGPIIVEKVELSQES